MGPTAAHERATRSRAEALVNSVSHRGCLGASALPYVLARLIADASRRFLPASLLQPRVDRPGGLLCLLSNNPHGKAKTVCLKNQAAVTSPRLTPVFRSLADGLDEQGCFGRRWTVLARHQNSFNETDEPWLPDPHGHDKIHGRHRTN